MDNDTIYKKFIVGKEYHVMNYETDKCSNISVLEHKGTWVGYVENTGRTMIA